MSETTPRPVRRTHLAELDTLRGLAVTCMVLNHSGFAWDDGESRTLAIRVLTYVGEFAPVLFFFTTGVGHGIRPHTAHRGGHFDTLYKVLLLFVADWFLEPGLALHTDFLAFIAVSMLLLHGVSQTARPIRWALGMFTFAVLGRFALGVALRHVIADPNHWLLALLGVAAVPFSSYTLLPWLAYPFAGYAVGYWLQAHDWSLAETRRRALRWLTAIAVCFGGVGAAMVFKGHEAYRWGSMSVAFFVQSVASLACGSLLACALHRYWLRASRLIACSGPESFAAVPIHYFLVHELYPVCNVRVLGSAVAVTTIALVPVVIEASRQFSRLVARLLRALDAPLWVAVWGGGLTLLLAWATLVAPEQWALRIACLAQLVICGSLVNRVTGLRKPISNPELKTA